MTQSLRSEAEGVSRCSVGSLPSLLTLPVSSRLWVVPGAQVKVTRGKLMVSQKWLARLGWLSSQGQLFLTPGDYGGTRGFSC